MKDNLTRYFSDVRKCQPLSAEKEIELAIEIQKGSKKALDELVQANLKFVITEARKYQGRGLDLEDLICEGNIGIIEAAKRFDPKTGFKFCSYAVWWIRQAILTALNENREIRLPFNQVNSVIEMNKAKAEFLRKNQREPSDLELAKACHITLEELRTLQRATANIVSVDTSIENEDNDNCTLVDIIENKNAEYADRSSEKQSLVDDIDRALACLLNSKEQQVLKLSFGLEETELSESEIGKKMNISAERVRQIRNSALSKLRKDVNTLEILREYLN